MKEIEVIARAIAVRDGKILLCRPAKTDAWYFFPGGHVEHQERASRSLKREMSEETGTKASGLRLIGAIENIYRTGATRRHELNLFFRARVVGGGKIVSKEKHIAFEWVTLAAFKKLRVMPESGKLAVLKWLKDGKQFTNI